MQWSIFDAAGGMEGLRRLAEAWHARVMADEVVSHAFSHGFHPQHTERLAAYWAEALGGPTAYSDAFGDETSVVRMHSGNGVHTEMDERAIACFDEALMDAGLGEDHRLRQVLHDYFAWATTTSMARYHESADNVPVGLRIPRWSWEGLVERPMRRLTAHRFRRAGAADVVAVRALIARSMAHWPRDAAYLAEAVELMSLDADDLERDQAWILEDEVGAIGFYRLSLAGERAEIEEFHLEPDRIGQGFGRKLFEHAVARAKERNVKRLEWSCDANALGFYLAMGGKVIGSRPSGIADDEPLTEMAIRIS